MKGTGRPSAYKTTDGKRVPGVTTIIGRFKESGGLIRWAWTCGRDGIDMDAARDGAADAGSIAHAMMEHEATGGSADLSCTLSEVQAILARMAPDDRVTAMERASQSMSAFRDWKRAVAIEVIATEVPFVSDRYRFGGTIDCVAMVGGRRSLVDWKTSNRIYHDYIIQVSAYRALWEEAHPDQPIEALHLLRVGKEFAEFAHHSWPLPVLDIGWRQFKLLREAYDLDATLRKAVG